MNEETFTLKLNQVNLNPDNFLLETAFPNKTKDIEIYIKKNQIKMESTVDSYTRTISTNFIDKFNLIKELGNKLYNNLDLISENYTIVTSSAEINTKYQKESSFQKKIFFFSKPYLNEYSINILKEYFIKYGYPYLTSDILLKLSQLKDNETYTLTLDITFFVYYCISIYIISETHFLILHNKGNEIKKFLPIYIINNAKHNKSIMWLCTRGIMLLINNINSLIALLSQEYSFYLSSIQYLDLNYYENILNRNYEYDLPNNVYITKDGREMKRKGNKLYDTYNIENLSYSEYKPTELLSKLIKIEHSFYNNIIIPTYSHLKYILSNSSKNSGYHYCIYCHSSFFGIGKECEKCHKLNSIENKKKFSDNKRYEKITDTYKVLLELNKKNNKLTKDEATYLSSIKSVSTFKKLYTKNKDKTKIDDLIKKMSNQ